MQIDFPYHFGPDGRTALTDPVDHVHDLIEQVLFTSPGERVNQPELGCGVSQLVFEPAGPELVTALEFTIKAALQRWLGDVIEPRSVSATVVDTTVKVTVEFVLRTDDEGVRVAELVQEVQR